MQPNYPALCATVLAVAEGSALHLLRQDLIYDLYRRGVLVLNIRDKLILSDKGLAVVEILRAGDHAADLD